MLWDTFVGARIDTTDDGKPADWGRGGEDDVGGWEKDGNNHHEGRWEERATFQGTNRRGETPQARAARIAAANRESARAREEDDGRGATDDAAAAAKANRNLNARRGGPGGRPALVRPNPADDDDDERPTWDGDVPAANIPNAREAKEARVRADVAAAKVAVRRDDEKTRERGRRGAIGRVDGAGWRAAWGTRELRPSSARRTTSSDPAAGARVNHGVAREGRRDRDDLDDGEGERVRR